MTYVLSGGAVLDGRGGRIPHGTVVLRDGRIAAVGSSGQVPEPTTGERIDTSGRTVLPGLFDAHVHVFAHAGEHAYNPRTWPITTFVEEQLLHAAANARLALECGITTLRDMAGGRPEVALRHALDDGVLAGPRLVTSGFIGMTGGHGDLFFPPSLDRRPFPVADGPDACRAAVRAHVRDGVDLIKICTSGGVLSLGDAVAWRNYTDAEVAAVVDEAHALGRRVAVHAHSRAGIAQALAAGVDTIEHGTELDDELAAGMAAAGCHLCPTLTITSYLVAEGAARGLEAEALEKARVAHARHREAMLAARRAGVKMFAGTDSCNAMPFGRHTQELALLVSEVGLTPMEAIVAATSTAAAACGLAGKTGELRAGLLADVVVVDGDPLADIGILQDRDRIVGVFRDGRLLVDRGVRVPAAGSRRG